MREKKGVIETKCLGYDLEDEGEKRPLTGFIRIRSRIILPAKWLRGHPNFMFLFILSGDPFRNI